MNRKFFTFTLVLMLCCFMATSAFAARKVDLVSANSNGYIQKMNSQVDHGHSNMGAIFGLTSNEKFTKVRETRDFNSVTHSRYQQSYKGIPIWGMETVVSRDHTDSVQLLNGSVAFGVPKDILNVPGTLDPKAALVKMQKQHKAKDAAAKWNFINEQFGTYIYVGHRSRWKPESWSV